MSLNSNKKAEFAGTLCEDQKKIGNSVKTE